MIKKYEVLEPFLDYKKGDVIPIAMCKSNILLVNFLINVCYLKKIEELPEWLSNIDDFVKFLESKYRLVLSFGRYEKIGEHLKPLILSQWLPEFAEHYNSGANGCEWYLVEFDGEFKVNHHQGLMLGTPLFKNGNFLKLFIDNAPQQVKDYLRGKQ
jgi:hypothetical protein